MLRAAERLWRAPAPPATTAEQMQPMPLPTNASGALQTVRGGRCFDVVAREDIPTK